MILYQSNQTINSMENTRVLPSDVLFKARYKHKDGGEKPLFKHKLAASEYLCSLKGSYYKKPHSLRALLSQCLRAETKNPKSCRPMPDKLKELILSGGKALLTKESFLLFKREILTSYENREIRVKGPWVDKEISEAVMMVINHADLIAEANSSLLDGASHRLLFHYRGTKITVQIEKGS